ncbi:lasso peptide biosynthesis B2 protein [Brevundimonas sp.]|jgi:Transglutaminase-like superfamily|uniref:lasso peptide biosynthesis B2 protein n=1 Tax=Brevundimonas sp. TaxID=1871086 RepID=UPI0028A2AF5D|nr:lasso peptide biosynthesis B2 protein [Brevundimonas sp.]
MTFSTSGTLSALPEDRAALAAGVFIAAVGEDLVVLDLRTDAYACIPEAARHVTLADGAVVSDLGVLGALADAGLLAEGPPENRPSASSSPVRTLDHRPLLFAAPAWPSLAMAAMTYGRLGPNPSVQSLLEALPRKPAGHSSERSVAKMTRAFQQLLPWLPGQGACLYRAFLLLTLLRRAGLDADWVFGVKTWPFSAHCWIQFGDAVLDDDPERVSAYRPIMVVQ